LGEVGLGTGAGAGEVGLLPLDELPVTPLDELPFVPLDEPVVPLDELPFVPLDEPVVPLDELVVPLDELVVPLDEPPEEPLTATAIVAAMGSPKLAWPETLTRESAKDFPLAALSTGMEIVLAPISPSAQVTVPFVAT